MKKIALLLAVCMAFSLTACGSSDAGEANTAQEPEESAATSLSVETDEEGSRTPADAESEADASANQVSIEPTVIYDENNLLVTAAEFNMDEEFGRVTLELQNNSSNDIDWTVWAYTINDCYVPCLVSYTVNAGTSGSEDFYFSPEDLDTFGITEIHTIALHSECMIAGEDNGTYVDSPTIVTSAGADFEQNIPLDQYQLLYDDKGIQVYYAGITPAEDEDVEGDYANLIVHNSSDSTVNFCPEDVSFDDAMADENVYSFTVYPNSYSAAYLVGSNLSAASDAAFHFYCSDVTTGETIFDSDKVTFSLNA